MYTNQETAQGRKKRFRVSLLLLTALFFVKIWTLGGHTNLPPDTTADEGIGGFTPVTEENAQVWGLAGDILNLFSGGHRSTSDIDREMEEDRAQREATDQLNQKRYEKEYNERREEERAAREQEMYDTQERRRAEDDAYHDQQQRQYEADRQRQEQNY